MDAVWVGWGAPGYHAAIASACEQAGATFIGPSSTSLRMVDDRRTLAYRLESRGVRLETSDPTGSTGRV